MRSTRRIPRPVLLIPQKLRLRPGPLRLTFLRDSSACHQAMWWDEDEPMAAADAVNFKTTHWSVVVRAGREPATDSAAALEMLCRTYWPPIYAFIRRKGHDVHAAQD